jgi:hypothetical protein
MFLVIAVGFMLLFVAAPVFLGFLIETGRGE